MAIETRIPSVSRIQLPDLNPDYGLELLRLDVLHPAISGNKWYKLRYNLEEAIRQGASSLLSFGGAWSNHLHALAFAGQQAGLSTIGYVRGEAVMNPTLRDCADWGMQLHFVSRETYRHKQEVDFLQELQQTHPGAYLIPEGGSNALGLKGCREILPENLASQYDLIACAVGTGTTLAGIAQTLEPGPSLLGFTVMKQGEYLNETLQALIPHARWRLETRFHGGGFGKIQAALHDFMQEFYLLNQVETDRVYTAKMLFGLREMIRQEALDPNLRILAIHTGGLQGNRSL